MKIAHAVQQARVSFFIPWQFGVDYDQMGRGSAQDLFDEQLDVRDLLRQADQKTRWAIIPTGMFTSFLFEPWFGVVDLPGRTITALGSLDNRVTVTTPEDIGRITADYIFLDPSQSETFKNELVFIGGDTISYNQLADIVERLLGQSVTRKVLTVDQSREKLLQDPQNSLLKYSIVFGEGVGVAWDLESTWNVKKGIEPRATTTEEFARRNFTRH
jgi:NmrA-like family